jgi:hypothetical protein
MTREDLIDEIWSVMQNVQDYDTGLHDFAKAVVRDVPLIAAAPDLLAALRKATHELNAIRARDGAPQHISWDRGHAIQTDGCPHEYWDTLTEECFAAIARATGAA